MIARLQIYKDAYSLTKILYVAISTMEKLHKHTMGARLLDTSLDMFKWMVLANRAKTKEERIVHLDSFIGTKCYKLIMKKEYKTNKQIKNKLYGSTKHGL